MPSSQSKRPPRDGIYIGVHGIWRCENCLQALWLTGQQVEDCANEHCGDEVPPLSDEMQAHARELFEEYERSKASVIEARRSANANEGQRHIG